MKYRNLGASGVKVSTLCLGGMTFGEADEKSFMHKVGSDEPTAHEVLDRALAAGVNFIDTADVYGQDGLSERVLGNWLTARNNRDRIVLATKFRFTMGDGPNRSGASRYRIVKCCEDSLRRLKTDRIDLYLLHWRGRPRLEETLAGFEQLIKAGAIRYWGVSNFDVGDMEELFRLSGGDACASNQVLYNLRRRGIEAGLLPWCRERGIPIMAYSPFEQGRLLRERVLTAVAIRHRATPAQIALAWILRNGDMMVIPKTASAARARENRAALDIELSERDLAELAKAFPAPKRQRPLELL